MEHSTCPSQRAIHTRRASFVPRRPLNMTTTKSGTTLSRSGPQILKDTKLTSPSCTDTEHSHWFRGWGTLDHCLGTHTQARGATRFDGAWLLPVNSAGAILEDATHKSIHILLPPHATEIYANSIVHAPKWAVRQCRRNQYCFVSHFAWGNKAFGHGTYVLSMKAS